jgi:hypothetical protein
MLTWKLFAAVTVAFIGSGITAAAVVQKAGFSCTVPWYTDTICIHKIAIPSNTQLQILVDSVTVKDTGEKYTFRCPVFNIYDADNGKWQMEYRSMCETGTAIYDNPFKYKEQIVYVRANVEDTTTVNINGRYTIYTYK